MTEQSSPKKLTRSRSDRYIGGVAAGLAERFSVDPIFVRIAFVASLALGGLGMIAYLVLLAVMPVEGDPSEPLPPIEPKRRNMMIGLAVIVGVISLVTASSGSFSSWLFGFWPGTLFGILFWSAAAILLIWLLATGKFSREHRNATGAGQTDKPAGSVQGAETSVNPADASTEVVTYAESPTQLSRTEIMETRQMSTGGSTGKETDNPPAGQYAEDAPSVIGRIMLWIAIGLAAIAVFSTLFVISAGTTVLFGGLPMAALVIILGGAMVYAGLKGRRQLSLWLLTAAVAVSLPMAAVLIADLRVEGSYGDLRESPVTATDIPDDGYRMAAGNMTIDLRKFDFQTTRNLEIPVNSGMGLTSVIVPDNICVAGEVTGKAGVINIRGRQTNGIDVTQDAAEPATPAPASPLVTVEGDFKLGAFEVVDHTQWRQDGRGGSFEDNDLEPDDIASAQARDRATAACAPKLVPRKKELARR
jgi:phage shock protein PspC (stress-responsive transcriptional regulator)/predicted membrane protein